MPSSEVVDAAAQFDSIEDTVADHLVGLDIFQFTSESQPL